MSFKVVKNQDGQVVGYGPNIDEYSPAIPLGGELVVSNSRPPSPEPKASSITPRQIRQALSAAGIRGQVEAAVAAGSQDLRDWWEFASMFERDHPTLIATAQALGMRPEQVDALFAQAATL